MSTPLAVIVLTNPGILGVSEMFEMMDTHEPYYSLKSKSGATSVTAASSAVFAALAVALMLVVA